MTGLAPTATALAGYFCISDIILISQSLYYNVINARKARQRTRSTQSEASEDEPLLQPRRRSSSGLPGSHRRHSVHHSESNLEPIKRVFTGEDDTPDSNPWLHNALSVAAVYIVGAAGWFISYKVGAWEKPDAADDEPSTESPVAILGMVLGYASALCYLWYVWPLKISPMDMLTSVKCSSPSDNQELSTEVLRRPRSTLLPALPHGQPNLRLKCLQLFTGACVYR